MSRPEISTLTRPDLIGASDVPALLGIDPYKGPAEVYARIVHGVRPASSSSEAGYWGLAIEPALAARFEAEHAVTLEVPAPIYNPKGRVWQRISLDRRIVAQNSPVELKTCSDRVGESLGDPGTEECLDQHWAQVQVQLEATDAAVAFVPYLVGGQEYREYVVKAHPEFQTFALEACERFWRDHIVTKRPPPASSVDEVRLLYPRVRRPELRETTEDEARLALVFLAARDSRKMAEDAEDKAKAALCEAIGDAKGVRGPWGKATWSEVSRAAGVRWQDVANELAGRLGMSLEALQEIATKFPSKGSEYRTLRVTLAKSEKEKSNAA